MKLNVGVFFGGSSVEHEISIISALQAIHALNRVKYEVFPIYISKDGVLYTGKELLDIESFKDLPSLFSKVKKVGIFRNDDKVIVNLVPAKKFGKSELFTLDLAFPILHGTNGEDGTIQGFFEMLRIPYVGPDITSSACGMDKTFTKDILIAHNISVLPYISFYSKDWHKNSNKLIQEIEEKFGYPVIVKPSNLGSSVGISKVKDRKALEIAVSLAQSFAGKILVEQALTSLREINCSVLGDSDSAEASACEEPVGSDEILSYSDKYMSNSKSKGMSSLKRKLPADIEKHTMEEIKSASIKAFKALGCSGVARIDFLLDTSNNNKVYLNELNTIPGSLAFYLWEATGKSYTVLLDELIALAFKRNRDRSQIMFTYNTNILAMQGGGSKGKK